MKNITSNKTFLPAIFFVAVIALIYHQWFFSTAILTKGDWMYYFPETLSTLRINYFSLWLSDFSFGRVLIDVGQAPSYAFAGFLAHYLNLNWEIIARIIYFFPTVLIGIMGTYILLIYCFKDRFSAIVGSLVFLCNTYSITLQTGHLTLAAATSFIPIFLYFYFKLFELNQKRHAIISALLFFIISSYEPRVTIVLSLIILLYTLYELIYQHHLSIKNFLLRHSSLFIFGFLSIAINSYWVIGLAQIKNVASESVLARPLWGSQYYDLLSAITLFHPWWTGGEIAVFEKQIPPPYFILIPIAAFLGFYFGSKNRKVLFFGILALLGILLTKQEAAPFIGLYSWLYLNLPGFQAFREASKFFILIEISYAILIASLVCYSSQWIKIKLIKHLIGFGISVLFLFNTLPIITKEINSLFVDRKVPNDYHLFNAFINSQKNFFDTLWVPISSRWGTFSEHHRKSDLVILKDGHWKSFVTTPFSFKEPQNEIMSVLKNNFASNLLSAGTIKYIVVPLQDIENDDDFFVHYGGRENSEIRQWYIGQLDAISYLNRIDIGTKELAVYENRGYLSYIRSMNSIVKYEDFSNLEDKYTLSNDVLELPFNFVIPKSTPLLKYPQTTISHLYENIAPANIHMGAITTKPNTGSESETLYVNTNAHSIEYTRDSNSLVFYKKYAPGIRLGGGNNDSIDAHLSKRAVLAEVPTTNNEYIGVQSGSILSLQQTESSKHLASTKNMTVYRVEKINAITNASFENGLWQETVGDCNNHDDNPILDMSLSSTAYRSSSSLELMATRHIACTNTYTEPLESGSSYLFSFAYQGDPAQQAGFHLSFGKEMDTNTVVSERLPISEVGNKWQEFSRILRVPEGAERAQLHLYAYATDNETANIVRYDAIRFAKIQEVAQVGLGEQEPNFEAIPLPPQESYEFTFSDPAYSMENLISNPSLEEGLWSKRVGDCNNHDDNPILDMRLSDIASDNNHSIELSATRHIACTGPRSVPVTNGSRYLLSFDYQGEGAKEAGYYIGFSGSNSPPSKNERIVMSKDAERSWKTYTKIIDVPEGAQSASLLVYAYATNGKQKNIVRYDNFSLIELPPIHNRYYLVSDPETNFVEPREITFDLVNPTKKLVHIKGATTPFYLAMSESYHPQWQAQLTNGKINGFFRSWIPWVKPDVIANDHHFELNGFLNGWYIDINDHCKQKNLCTKNADGSYDIELTLEFFPQRWFYLGLLISGTTLLACLGYLAYDFARRRKNKQ